MVPDQPTNRHAVLLSCLWTANNINIANVIFDILEQSSLQKHTTCWVFLVLYHMLYLCICIFVFACLIHGNIICDILEQFSSKIYNMLGFFGTLSYAVFVYLCMYLVNVLISLRPTHSLSYPSKG